MDTLQVRKVSNTTGVRSEKDLQCKGNRYKQKEKPGEKKKESYYPRCDSNLMKFWDKQIYRRQRKDWWLWRVGKRNRTFRAVKTLSCPTMIGVCSNTFVQTHRRATTTRTLDQTLGDTWANVSLPDTLFSGAIDRGAHACVGRGYMPNLSTSHNFALLF